MRINTAKYFKVKIWPCTVGNDRRILAMRRSAYRNESKGRIYIKNLPYTLRQCNKHF